MIKKSRKFIDKKGDSIYEVINKISVNAAFSRMDSFAYPLLNLYCEDNVAEYIIKNILIELNQTNKHFDRLINIIRSGPVDQVKNDYERHKRNYSQMRMKVGYCCVFDGDYKEHKHYSNYYGNPNEFSFFLYPYSAPEKFLIKAYLAENPNQQLNTALSHTDHHALFSEMVNIGLVTDKHQAIEYCWQAFKKTSEYTVLSENLKSFIKKVAKFFSGENE